MRAATPRVARVTRTLVALLGLLPLAACAGNEHLLDVQVVDLDQSTPLWPTRFEGRDYIAGNPGHRFSVTLQNRTGERVLAVLSVDGINAISGQTAGASQAGYVLDAWQRVEVRGWRKSYSDVAEFYFTDLPDSYGARTGRPENVGVIGVAAFRERRPPALQYAPPAVAPPVAEPMPAPQADDDGLGAYSRGQAARKSAGNTAPPAAAEAAAGALADASARRDMPGAPVVQQQLGTGHGERRYDPVAQTQFERDGARPNQRVALFYDAVDALAARGIFGPRRGTAMPQAFPIGFVPDPD